MRWDGLLTALADLFLPRECIVCGRTLLRRERHLCLGCMEDIPRTFHFSMEHNSMADRYNAIIQRDLEAYEPYSRAAALFFYNAHSGYRLIPQSVKYRGNVAAGRFFGDMLGSELLRGDLFGDVTVVMPVPLHWRRRRRRGYNQAEVIARSVAGAIGAPCRTDVLSRPRSTRTQTRLAVEEKARNVHGAFQADAGRLSSLLPESGDVHILLIDDVFTTGATLAACHRALRTALATLGVPPDRVRISAATLACVGGS